MPTAPIPFGALTVIAQLIDAGVGAFWDYDESMLIAHPATISEDDALMSGQHIMVNWSGADRVTAPDGASFEATAWEPDGLPDYDKIATVYATPVARPFDEEAARCARAVAEWFAGPRLTAGDLLIAALAEYGITAETGMSVDYGTHSDIVSVALPLPYDAYAHLIIADRDGSLRHVPAAHIGWSVFLHNEEREALGDPVYIAGDGGFVDCAEDSAAAAEFIADFLTSPVSRHCDCYAQEGHGRRHDDECNRYRRP
ncbi:hypothetical protein AB0I69_42800 [Streptomyces sp. NPDC050508]|uniref:hypothetical protein n=1 Tax=Streptomyces sp. NPDC050508 TaxID=3155405 RepID=UPI00343BCF13